MKRKLRIVIDCGDTFCAGCAYTSMRALVFGGPMKWCCDLFDDALGVAGESKPKRHAKCLEAEGMR